MHEFRKTSLYQHYVQHYATLYDLTVTQILEEPLKGPETLYSREAWIGEARTTKLNRDWFEVFHSELSRALQKLDK